MFKHMLLGLGVASLLVVVTAMPVQAAAITPDALKPFIVTGNNGAWEWVWVSPCAEGAQGCSFKKEVDGEYYGFRPPDPTNNIPWTESFNDFRGNNLDFLPRGDDNGLIDKFFIYGPADPFTGIQPITGLKCAVTFFSQDYDGCNDGDLRQGAVAGAPFPIFTTDTTLLPDPTTNLVAEAVWFRPKEGYMPAPLPEPSSLLLLGAGLLGLAAWRWKHAA